MTPTMQRMIMAMFYPILAILIIVVFAGGLGVIFMLLESSMGNEIGVILLGLALVIGVPLVAFLIQRAIEKQ